MPQSRRLLGWSTFSTWSWLLSSSSSSSSSPTCSFRGAYYLTRRYRTRSRHHHHFRGVFSGWIDDSRGIATTTTTTFSSRSSWSLLQSATLLAGRRSFPMTTSTTAMSSSHPGFNSSSPPKQEEEEESPTALSRLVHGQDDALFGWIETMQQEYPPPSSSSSSSSSFDAAAPGHFGRVLDAGTGLHSLRWLASLVRQGRIAHYTAVTADPSMQRQVQAEAQALGVARQGRIVLGNWLTTGGGGGPVQEESNMIEVLAADPLDRPPVFDTILVDYLIGALEGFSPYQQDLLLPQLLTHVKVPGGRLYMVGMEPIPDRPSHPDQQIISRVRQVRDACILLAGHACYREYPLAWVLRQVQRLPQLRVVGPPRSFPILYRHETIVKQINVARSKLPFFQSPALAAAMAQTLHELEQQSREATQQAPNGRISLGFDYVVTVERIAE